MIRPFVTSLLILMLSFFGQALAQPQMPPTMVETLVVGKSTQRPSLEAVGTLKAQHGIVVRPEIPGRITEIYVQSGQSVNKGEPLVQLNPVIVQAQLDTIKTRLELSEKTAKRYQELMKTKVISKEDFDKVMATRAQDKAQLAEAKARLEQTKIVAAFTGKVGLRQVSVGDYVQAGQALVNLQSQDPILVEFAIPETKMRDIRVGQVVKLNTDAYPDRHFEGVVSALESRVDSATRTLTVQAKVSNPERLLLPGAFVSVNVDLNKAENVLTIPQAAVLYHANQAYVYRMMESKAVKTDIKLGKKSAGNVVVLSGLKVGDEIITAGQHKLMPGAPVMKLAAPPSQ